MTTTDQQAVSTLVAGIDYRLGPASSWPSWPGGWPGEIEVCLVDAVYSANARYGRPASERGGPTGVHRVVQRLREVRGGGKLDDLYKLVAALEEADFPALGSRQVSPGTDQPKETTVQLLAESLSHALVADSQHLHNKVDRQVLTTWPRHPLHGRVRGAGDVTWNYFLMLHGRNGVKADRMIRDFVRSSLDLPVLPSSSSSAQLVNSAAKELGVTARDLDHAIWRFQRKFRNGIGR